MTLAPLPIDASLPEICAALRDRAGLVLRAPTGAGKTTRVPPALLRAGLAGQKQIMLLEPRRLAARAAARRMAQEWPCRLGDEIGYQVRFDNCCGPRTRLLVVTPGILLQRVLHDPYLDQVGLILCDEFHERSLEIDLALGILRLVQQTVRPDLKLVVMSATLQTETVAAYLGDAPVLVSEGRSFPVEIRHQSRPAHQSWTESIESALTSLLNETPGDILVFLPGLQEIRQTSRHLTELAAQRNLAILPLHGDLPPQAQDAALLPQKQRKVILATNVAETSVTVEGVTGVIDTGLARQLFFDPRIGLNRLQLIHISQASALQRAGRAGRTQPGVCVRLWSEAAQRTRSMATEPDIRRVDLAGAVLHLLSWGEKEVQTFPWLEAPPAATVHQSLALLERLGAVRDRAVTPLGRAMAGQPLHPRLARLLLAGRDHGVARSAALAAALLSEKSPFAREENRPRRATPTRSDVLEQVRLLESVAQGKPANTTLHRAAAQNILRVQEQLWRSLPKTDRASPATTATHESEDSLLRALLAAFPDRLARRRGPGSRQGLMVGGRGVRLAPESGVSDGELFLCIDVDNQGEEAWVRVASAVQRDWLPAELLRQAIEVDFDPDTQKVIALKRVYFLDLLLEEGTAALPQGGEVERVLLEAARQNLDAVLPAEDSPARSLLDRIRWLGAWMPELKLPAFRDEGLHEILSWLCPGCRSFEELRRADWSAAIVGKLTPAQRQAVEREAPERLQVPSGSRIAVQYAPDKPPVLAVRIQELFGLAETPRLAGGRVKMLLHLLAPNYRPQQVTDDLASFWRNTYAVVRKELRARYPKHAWPEDPWNATAERRPQRR